MADVQDNDVKIDIKAMSRRVSPRTKDCCIYRVPYPLRKLNEDAFTPTVVSIGPFHYGNPRLPSMEMHKQVFFLRFIQRSKKNPNSLVNKVIELEHQIRHSYSEDIVKPEKEELIELILVDACFILELFLLSFYHDYTENDLILLRSCFHYHILMDLLLLENQLPFIVLKELFNLAFSSHRNGSLPSLLELTFHFFGGCNKQNLAPDDVDTIKHFTDLLRIFYLQPSSRRSPRKFEQVARIKYSANKLREAGVKLRKDETNKCLLDFKFSRPHLQVPKLTVDDSTENLFRNMVALEQCHYLVDTYITDYVCMMDNLIDGGNDVDVLVHKGIMFNRLEDSNAVVKLFNSLGTNVVRATCDIGYNNICIELNKFCEDFCNKKKATLRRDYCGTPWQTVASLAGMLLLILTIIQTVCSIVQVV